MAHTVTGASLNDIYTKLNDAPEYHPMDANTFADWSMEAGDVITVKRGDEEYQSPIHSSRMVWKGTPQTNISSTGKKERDAVSKVSRKKYGRGGTAVRSQEYIYKEFTSSDGMLHSAIYMSESKLTTQFDNAISDVHSSIVQTAEQIYSEVHASSSTLYSYIDQTATYIESVVADVNNNLGSAILQTASQIRSEVHAANSTLYSYVDQTATYISAVVESVESSLGSNIVQTANQIYSEVHAANSTVYSYIDQTATSITSRVEDVNSDLHSEILQTQSMIRSAVWTANSTVYSYVDQTASYILQHVGERSGAKVFTGTEKPVDTPENPLNVGDLWIEGTGINLWDDFEEGEPWVDYDPTHPEYDWSQLRGQKVHVYEADGDFHLVLDETTLAEGGDILQLSDGLRLIAYNQQVIDNEFRSNVSRLDVRADHITANVQEQVQKIGSDITQTATQIRAEVHAANSQLYSAIEQTATSIRSYVVDEINDVGSEILQTASQIRAEVHSSNSTLYSYIDMTSTNIRQVVANVQTGLQSSINVESNRIDLVVEGTGANAKIKPASIVNSINNGSSSIVISANHINLDGYVKASDITTNYLSAKLANFGLLTSERGGINVYSVGTTSYTQGGVSCYVPHAITSLRITRSGNTYTLQKKWFSESDWTDVPGTFSRAVSSWDWTGGNGQVKVTAQPQNQTLGVDVKVSGSDSITSNGSYTYKVQYADDNDSYWDTGATLPVTVNVKPTNLAIYDVSSNVVTSATVNAGSSLYLWAGYNIGSSWTWGSQVTITSPNVTINSSVTSKNSQKSDPGSSYSTISETKVPASDGERWVWFTVNASNGESRKFKMYIKVV